MNEIDKTKSSDQTKFRLDEIKKTENFFHEDIIQRKLSSKKLSKYVTTFNYIDKILIVLNATSGGVCTISYTSIVGAPVGIASAGFTILFYLATGITKKLLKTTRSKKKKHDQIQALIDMEISHEEFTIILKEKDKYE